MIDFNEIEFKKLINDIVGTYKSLKEDKTNFELYSNMKKLLKELEDLIENHKIPNDIFVMISKFYINSYRLMETTYIGHSEKKKK